MAEYQIWIEAEAWARGEWNVTDDATDVHVRFADGGEWVATFITYLHLQTLRERFRKSGECLGGRYLWITDMLPVEEVSRPAIEEVVRELLATGEFYSIFRLCSEERVSGLAGASGAAHPYVEFESAAEWKILAEAIAELEENQDFTLTTAPEYVVGYLCKRLKEGGAAATSKPGLTSG